jgi:hypothetical protein
MVADTLYGHPHFFLKGESLSALACYVTVAAASGKLIRLGLYAYAPTTGFAGELLWDAGTVLADATLIRECASGQPYVVPATGWYVVAGVSDGTPTVTSWNATAGGLSNHWAGQTNLGASLTPAFTAAPFSRAFTFASLPNPFGGSPAFVTTNTMVIAGKIT